MMVFPRRLPQPDPSSYCHQQQQETLLEQERLLQEMKLQSSPNKLQQNESFNSELMTFCDINSPSVNTSIGASTEKQKTLNLAKLVKFNKKQNVPAKNSGFTNALKRLLKNDILLCRTASSVLHILPISGLYTFLPKYLESQFQLTATDANIIAGLAGILVMGIGIFASGTFMRKYKPSARFVARWIALAALSYVIGMCVLMFMGCPTNKFAGLKNQDANGYVNEHVTYQTIA